jgi:hypothetical protein
VKDSTNHASPATPAPPAASAPPAALEYDRSGNHVTRGQFRILLILMLINTVAIVGYVALPGGTQWARQQWKDFETKRAAKAREQQKRDLAAKRIEDFRKVLPALASMKLPADPPVYTEDAIEAASLLASNPAYQTVRFERAGMEIKLWQPAVMRTAPIEVAELQGAIGISGGNVPTAFVHARKNPSGAERLVWCVIEAEQLASSDAGDYVVSARRTLRVRLIDPGSTDALPKLLAVVDTEFDQRGHDERARVNRDGTSKTPQTFRLLAGVADPADATRCTLPYVMNGASGAFVVRVMPHDRLLVEPTDGRIAQRVGDTAVQQKWDPSGQPAVRVSEGRP